MIDLKLEQDEHIICRTKEAWRYDGDEELELESLFLTNKHLIGVYKKSIALFFEGKTVVDKKPLALISISDGIPQVKNIVDDNFGEVLQILFDNGMEELYFLGDAHENESSQWESDIKKATIEDRNGTMKNDKPSEDPLIAEESEQIVAKEKTKKKLSENSERFVFCTNCGEKNNIGARFCQHCGTSLVNENKSRQNVTSHKDEQQQSTYYERKQEYAGKIKKCPVCGQELSSTDAVCPSCGHEMNEVRIHPILEKFINELNECDFNIVQEEMTSTIGEPKKKLGWSHWKAPMKVLWLAVNCFTLCAPLVVYYVVLTLIISRCRFVML